MVDQKHKNRLSEIAKSLFRIERLPSIPHVLHQLVEAVGDNRTDAAKLERIIESDQGLASKVLSLANSPFYGFSQRITTIRRAVVALGYKELQLLALGTCLTKVFDPGMTPPQFDAKGLWTHSLSVSWFARELSEKARYDSPGEILVAGLMHDIGKLILSTHLHEDLSRIIEKLDNGEPYYQAEEELGVPHTLLGYMLATKWGLPSIHLLAIRYHHNPFADNYCPFSTSLIALADREVKRLGFGLIHKSRPIDNDYILKQTRLEEDMVEEVARNAKEALPKLIGGWQEGLFDGQHA
ncbi:MAG: HDOD domain-containing protein [Deltaproteobacteria bacterium]|nr:HDOD domain-containing protein [Deltaproteobacteria bacterium]